MLLPPPWSACSSQWRTRIPKSRMGYLLQDNLCPLILQEPWVNVYPKWRTQQKFQWHQWNRILHVFVTNKLLWESNLSKMEIIFNFFFVVLIGTITSPTIWASKRTQATGISRRTATWCTAVVPAHDHTKLHTYSFDTSPFLPPSSLDWFPFNQVRDRKMLFGPEPALSPLCHLLSLLSEEQHWDTGRVGGKPGISPAASKAAAVVRAGQSCYS